MLLRWPFLWCKNNRPLLSTAGPPSPLPPPASKNNNNVLCLDRINRDKRVRAASLLHINTRISWRRGFATTMMMVFVDWLRLLHPRACKQGRKKAPKLPVLGWQQQTKTQTKQRAIFSPKNPGLSHWSLSHFCWCFSCFFLKQEVLREPQQNARTRANTYHHNIICIHSFLFFFFFVSFYEYCGNSMLSLSSSSAAASCTN